MIRGDLVARSGMTFTRKDLRAVIHRVDEEGVENRSDFLKKRIKRCEYDHYHFLMSVLSINNLTNAPTIIITGEYTM